MEHYGFAWKLHKTEFFLIVVQVTAMVQTKLADLPES
jgi:hypothetical protein